MALAAQALAESATRKSASFGTAVETGTTGENFDELQGQIRCIPFFRGEGD
jgi:hypothetical protein